MKTRIAALLLSCALGAATYAQAAPAPRPDGPDVLRHVAAAKAMAGERFAVAANRFCLPGPLRKRGYPDTVLPPAKVFDNLYFLGLGDVYAWALDTPRGIVLMDTLNNPHDAEVSIEGGLRTLGLDPARIKYIVVTHAHADHFGGARYLADKYRAHVLASPEDWKGMAEAAARSPGPRLVAPPAHDMDALDGKTLTLGGTTLTFVATPGHTPGAISVFFPVKAEGRTYMAALLNGTRAPSPEALRQMIGSYERLAALAKAAKVEVEITNHSFVDDSLPRLEQVRARKAGDPNPFLIGEKGFQDFLGFQTECMKADVARAQN